MADFAPLTLAALDAEARAGLQRLLAGEPPTEGAAPWSPADVRRLWALVRLGRPAEVVANGPPVAIAKGDNWGGRMLMPGEAMRASVQHAWHGVARHCGEPLPGPHDTKGGGLHAGADLEPGVRG